jgi:hypothetical protein
MRQADGDPGPFMGPCAFCGAQVGEDDYCPGCKVFVCAHCDQRPRLEEVYGVSHRRSLHGAIERRQIAQEVERGRAAMKAGRVERSWAPSTRSRRCSGCEVQWPPPTEWFLVRLGDGRLVVVRITHAVKGQTFIRLQFPPPNPAKEG